ncbi:MAG: dTDP-glucose 4,6-dehydratase [Candidatus Falkowbacteria bacterium]|nr:dTDP-glucose 4,6-dehydratase [Candidatus Falkowbacteria bacterium]
MKLLVTGGAGFIGSHFIRQWFLVHPDDEIINLDILTYAGRLENLSDVESNPKYRFVKGDICDEKLVAELIEEVDLVVHFAAESHVDRSIESSKDFIRSNVEGTRVLLEAARKKNIPPRFHHVSTDEVFGSLKLDDKKFTELSSYDPRSPYSASKAASDHLARAYFHTYGLPITISNCSNNYGPYQFPEKLIPRFVTNILLDKKLPLYGQGENVRDWIYVIDHVEGIMKVIAQGRIGETYCLGGDNELNNLTIAKEILKLLDKDEAMVEYVADRLGHDLRYAIDYTKARTELNWSPNTTFTEGLKHTTEWYKNNKTWWQSLI